jgi:hypothetical protein
MVDELDEARERAKAAWSLVQADVIRLKEAVRSEVDHVKQLGPKSIWNSYPLPVLGAIAGLGLVLGVRGGRRRAAYRAIVRAGTDVVSTAATEIKNKTKPRVEKTLKRKLVETLALAVASKGAQVLAQMAQEKVHAQLAGSPVIPPPPPPLHAPVEKEGFAPRGRL